MQGRHWIEIVALTSALGLTGTAIAQGMNPTTGTVDRSGVSADESPSSGAIITPEDKAAGMGRNDEHARSRDGAANDDTSRSNDDMSVNPGPSSDDMSVNPGAESDEMSVNPDRGDGSDSSTRYGTPASSGSVVKRGDAAEADEDESASSRSHGRPGDMGPQDNRGQ
jgi:hypothetical protein